MIHTLTFHANIWTRRSTNASKYKPGQFDQQEENKMQSQMANYIRHMRGTNPDEKEVRVDLSSNYASS